MYIISVMPYAKWKKASRLSYKRLSYKRCLGLSWHIQGFLPNWRNLFPSWHISDLISYFTGLSFTDSEGKNQQVTLTTGRIPLFLFHASLLSSPHSLRTFISFYFSLFFVYHVIPPPKSSLILRALTTVKLNPVVVLRLPIFILSFRRRHALGTQDGQTPSTQEDAEYTTLRRVWDHVITLINTNRSKEPDEAFRPKNTRFYCPAQLVP